MRIVAGYRLELDLEEVEQRLRELEVRRPPTGDASALCTGGGGTVLPSMCGGVPSWDVPCRRSGAILAS